MAITPSGTAGTDATLVPHLGYVFLDVVCSSGQFVLTHIGTNEQKPLPLGHQWQLDFDDDGFRDVILEFVRLLSTHKTPAKYTVCMQRDRAGFNSVNGKKLSNGGSLFRCWIL